jgi:hypothetical protein
MEPFPKVVLPPIRQHSPKPRLSIGSATSPITLPSISAQLRDLNQPAGVAADDRSPFSQPQPARSPHRYSGVPNHGSPLKFSETFPVTQRIPQTNTNVENYTYITTYIPGTRCSASTPRPAIDQMSIDGMRSFPTQVTFIPRRNHFTVANIISQYLLKSHTHLHSINQRHYCSVTGCARGESGKGFKRKNEMIRHRLVHNSPGYICPFCPDKERQYPRPDNLRR